MTNDKLGRLREWIRSHVSYPLPDSPAGQLSVDSILMKIDRLLAEPEQAPPAVTRCDSCDPSYSCFNGSATCTKRPPAVTDDEIEAALDLYAIHSREFERACHECRESVDTVAIHDAGSVMDADRRSLRALIARRIAQAGAAAEEQLVSFQRWLTIEGGGCDVLDVAHSDEAIAVELARRISAIRAAAPAEKKP